MRTEGELQELSTHLLYEIEMMYAAARILSSPESRASAATVRNALLESFVVHFRALHEFLWAPRSDRWREDARAGDFFEPGRWETIRPEKEKTILEGPARVGREVAHLSYRRPLPADEWMVAQIAASVGRCFREFLGAVDASVLTEDFEARVRACWPRELNFPAAVSFPGDHDPPGVATTMVFDASA